MKCWPGWFLVLPWIWPGLGTAAKTQEPPKPIRALLVAGGCCHDYARQKDILTRGIARCARVEWTIAYDRDTSTRHLNPIYDNPDWAKGFDIVVHDECSADVRDKAAIDRILGPHRDGLPGVVLHCAMHCYRTEGWNRKQATPWMQFTGLISTGHGLQRPIAVTYVDKDSPITRPLSDWTTVDEELYNNAAGRLEPTAHALARGKQGRAESIVAWTNTYNGKTRVFGTTLGHNNQTVGDPRYLDLVTRGLLWAVDRLDDRHLRADVELVPENLARGKPATASSSQQHPAHPPGAAVDGNPATRWCADGDRRRSGGKWTWASPATSPASASSGSRTGSTIATRSRVPTTASPGQCSPIGRRATRRTGTSPTTSSLVRCGSSASPRRASRPARGPASSRSRSSAPRRSPLPNVPRWHHGPCGAGQDGLLGEVKAPAGLQVTLFARPPDVRYPTCLAAAPTGEVFVGIDENGSLDSGPRRGRVVRCIDQDDDGKADRFNVFATMDSPRGLVWDDGTLYVLHPPDLTAYHDDDGDGMADRSETLVKGIGFDLKFRGADHTTNGIRLGIDGYIYVAVGDYGFIKALGKDRRALQYRGGGVVRVRTDGSGLEAVSRGQRNIYDVAIDPLLNLFTRDNTNDGDGWDVRLSHVVPTGNLGYPSLFKNFADEIVLPLADYGGGSPTGSIYLQEPGLPPPYGDSLYTCEWGREAVFRHPLGPAGAGFKAGQELFLTLPRPTDIDVDGRSRVFVTSWRGATFTYDGPDVGYVIRVSDPAANVAAFPDLKAASDWRSSSGISLRAARSSASRPSARSCDADRLAPPHSPGARSPARAHGPMATRVAAVFTLERLPGRGSIPTLVALAGDPKLARVRPDRALRPQGGCCADPHLAVPEGAGRRQSSRPAPRRHRARPAGEVRGGSRARRADRRRGPAGRPRGGQGAGRPWCGRGMPVGPRHLHAQARPRRSPCPAGDVQPRGRGRPDRPAGVARSDDPPTGVPGALPARSPRGRVSGRLVGNAARYERALLQAGRLGADRADRAGPRRGARAGGFARGSRPLDRPAPQQGRAQGASAVKLDLAGLDPAARSGVAEILITRRSLSEEAARFLEGIALSDRESPALRARVLAGLRARRRTSAIVVLAAIGRQENPPPELLAAWRDFLRDDSHARRVAEFRRLADDADPARRELGYAVLLSVSANPRTGGRARAEADRAIEAAWKAPRSAASLLTAIGRSDAVAHAFDVRNRLADKDPEVARGGGVRRGTAGARPRDRPRPGPGHRLDAVRIGRSGGPPNQGRSPARRAAVPAPGLHRLPYRSARRAGQGAVPRGHLGPV